MTRKEIFEKAKAGRKRGEESEMNAMRCK